MVAWIGMQWLFVVWLLWIAITPVLERHRIPVARYIVYFVYWTFLGLCLCIFV